MLDVQHDESRRSAARRRLSCIQPQSVLPLFKELNSILFYPVQHEGEESERNVLYTGAAPNQEAIPAVDYVMVDDGGEGNRWALEGTDYVYPRIANKILEVVRRSTPTGSGVT